jgi:hypothetical protein
MANSVAAGSTPEPHRRDLDSADADPSGDLLVEPWLSVRV